MVPDLLERGVNFDIYSIDGVASVDTFLRYETLADDLRRFLQGLGIENGPELPCVKSSGRAVSWRDFYDDDTRRLVAQANRRELELFGYGFDD